MGTEGNPLPMMTGARSIAARLSSPDRIQRAIDLIENSIEQAPGYAFDLAKNLIETVCRTILKECGQDPGENPDVHKLAKATLDAVLIVPDGHPDPTTAKRHLDSAFRNLSGVVLGVGTLRNMEGELGHGRESDRVSLASYHAEFAVRAADAIVKFLFECHRAPTDSLSVDTITYSENVEFNNYIDELFDPIQIFSNCYKASDVLFKLDVREYKGALAGYIEERKAEAE